MKRKISFFLVLVFALTVLPFSAFTASADTYGDYEYTVLSDGTVEIKNYNGNEENVSIPEYIDGKKVTSIGWGAFSGCESLINISIPDSVTSICKYAFFWCQYLKSIIIPDGVTSIGEWAFNHCSSLTSIIIPNNVTSIGISAFYECYGLTSVIIGSGVTSIGQEAFADCTNLTSITIPNSVTSMGNGVFGGCTRLSDVYCEATQEPEGWDDEWMDEGDFTVHWGVVENGFEYSILSDGTVEITKYNGNAANVSIPEYIEGRLVTSIGDCAFYNCESLKSISIPDSVTSIGEYAFYGCTSLANITIPESVTSIDDFAFEFCTNLTSINIPDSVTKICIAAFGYCTSLKSITLSNSVTSIDHWAFYGCSSLTSITIPDSVTSIGNGAFGCTSLESINIPGSVASIAEHAFSDCESLESIKVNKDNTVYHSAGDCLIETASKTLITGCKNSVIPKDGSVTSIGYAAFDNCTGLKSINIPDSVTSIAEYAFEGCSSLTSINIPDSVTSIHGGAFRGCTDLTSVNIPASVTRIGDYYFGAPFGGCDSLTSITVDADNPVFHSSGNCIIDTENKELIVGCKNSVIPKDGSVTSIGYAAFAECTGLKSITIPDSVTSIGDWAFDGCTSLSSITIPASVTNTGWYIFGDCEFLTDIYCEANQEPEGWDGDWLVGCDATVHWGTTAPDPAGELEYSLNEAGSGYIVTGMGTYTKNSINIPETYKGLPVESIGEKAFENCADITEVTISAELYKISENAFKGCTNLNNVSIVGYVSDIEDFAFSGCTALTEIRLPKSVRFVGFRVFDRCTKLTDIYCGADKQPEEWDEWWSYGCSATVHWGVGNENANVFTYLSTFTGKNEEYDFYYSDSFFDHSAYEYDHQLARMSLCAAMASMGYYKGEANTGSNNIKELYGKIGIDNNTIEDHYHKPNNNADSIGFVIGSKNITCSDGDYSLVVVTIRSGGYENEWISNFMMGENGDHEGFSAAANEVKDSIIEYISNPEYDLSPNKKVWIQGYSRGGAVTNLTAAYLDKAVSDKEIKGLDLKDIYAYGFEVPQGRSINTPGSDSKIYNNIFSIVNPNDLVTKVAPSAYGFGRYGVTLETPTALNSKNTGKNNSFENVYVSAMISEYDDILSRLSEVVPDTFDYGTAYKQQLLFDYLIECIAGAIGTRKDYYSIQYSMAHLAGYAMMEKFDKLEPVTVSITYLNEPGMYDVIFTTEDSDGDGKPDEPDIKLEDFLMAYSFGETYTLTITSVDILIGNYYVSLSKKQFDKLLNGFFDYYYRETGERINMEIIRLKLKNQADEEHVKGLFTNLTSLKNIPYAHYPELCLAWMNATNDLVGFLKTRYLYIHCPVDVNVYDGGGELVASIVNDSVAVQGSGAVQAYVDAVGTKIFLLPDNEEYKVEVIATGNGEVDYSVAEYDHSAGMFTRYVDYKGITVTKGATLNGVIEDLGSAGEAEYELRDSANKSIPAANDVQGAGANALALNDHSPLDKDISEFIMLYIPGDVNGNGKIDSKDYAMCKRAVLKTYTLSDEQSARTDVSGNGKVDAKDYAMIKRHFLRTYVIPGAEGL